MPAPHIRPARLDDEEPLARLDRDTWSPLHAVTPRPGPPHPPFFTEGSGPADHLVAEYGDRVVRYVRLGLPAPLARKAHVWHIAGLGVAEDDRRLGFGPVLLRGAVAASRALGARRLT